MTIQIRIFIFLFLPLSVSHGQSLHPDDSTGHRKIDYWRELRAPLILTTIGMVATTDNEVFDKWEVRELRETIAPNFKTQVDNYLLAVPVVTTFILDIAGMEGRSDLLNQTILLVKSELIVAGLTFSLKTLTHVERPDRTTHDSFPSGHTTHAFMAATFLHKEFGQGRPWVSVLAYTTASGVGILRILNDRHWVSDVVVGAGLGILSANVAYMTHKYKWGRSARAAHAQVMPFYQRGSAGLSFTYRFASK